MMTKTDELLGEVLDRLSYKDGVVYWEKSYFKSKIGKPVAGTIESGGYAVVKVCGKMLKLHQVVWALNYKMWPESWVDHIDGDRVNNNINNLRLVTFSQSNANRKKTSATKLSKYKGVSKNRHYTWKATIQDKFLGCYPTQELAAEAYNKAAKEIFGEYAKLNDIERYEE